MSQRYSFLVFLALLVAATGWWAKFFQGELPLGSLPAEASVDSSQAPVARVSQNASIRRELLESLDRLVAYELYYRSVYGRFTKILNRVGIAIPRTVAQVYEIHVVEASSERLVVAAFSEAEGRVVDQVSINQDFEVRANFKLPLPRPEFLRAQATRHLRQLRDAMPGKSVEEQGVFKDYFRFDVRKDSEERRVAFAVGIRPPVVGMQLEYGPAQNSGDYAQYEGLSSPLDIDLADLPEAGTVAAVGQGVGSDVMTTGEEANLAQKIFHGEMGRYAKTLSELSRIANFQFDSKDENDSTPKKDAEPKALEATRQIGSVKGDLEIEPIDSASEN